ncbi:DUF6346 domain-containing protein [Saccharopolyspora sp. TS4A08]|uniref:DUF6346 domain-containing protein n=1 Tax=Saccharopolyspora ipomoeae TaxID=3042027 RepID=A0ABT6PKM9_9PSEU|nr:DUF6346 domain-containing protein [Saccharopolyspora sp. TS4A08]MDI2028477.1 DUF6346 domain-containing protein [Saccharopolyspora sp. TS4A08]
MWKSDNPLVRVLRVLIGFAIVALIALTALTVIFAFPAKTGGSNATAVARSCEDYGPISRRGFGHHWGCTAQIRDDKTGETWTDVVDMNVLQPQDVGRQERITWGFSGGRVGKSENRVYRSPDGYSDGVNLAVTVVVGFAALLAMLWFFAKAVVWGFTQEGQRKFWEKIHGSNWERAAKKQHELEERERRRQRWAEVKAHREQVKEEKRRSGR